MPTLAQRNHNPGNLRGSDGKFRAFESDQAGFEALHRDIEIKMTGRSKTGLKPSSTIADFLCVYAPQCDNNNPSEYARFVAQHLDVNVHTPIGTLTGRIADFANAIAIREGFFVTKKP